MRLMKFKKNETIGLAVQQNDGWLDLSGTALPDDVAALLRVAVLPRAMKPTCRAAPLLHVIIHHDASPADGRRGPGAAGRVAALVVQPYRDAASAHAVPCSTLQQCRRG